MDGDGPPIQSMVTSREVHTELADTDSSIPSSHKDVTESLWMDSSFGAVAVVQVVFLVVLCILGTLINSLVFWVFNRRPALRSLSNRFVLSLVTANFLISSITAPLLLLESVLRQWISTECIDEIIWLISNSVTFSAIFSTVLIAVDRFYAVTSPLHYSMTITRLRSQLMIVLAWICGVVLSLPYTIICSIPFSVEMRQNLHMVFSIVQIFLGYVFPFLILFWLYCRMYNAAHRNSERTRKHSISGELLTVMDGTTSMIPQGIDFLTHYMNPFSKTPMAGSVQHQSSVTSANGTTTTTTTTTSTNNTHHHNNNNNNTLQNASSNSIQPSREKKHRRRSSNGSSSSLLFREEGRAIKTAFFVLAAFLLCWTPSFSFILVSELDTYGSGGINNTRLRPQIYYKAYDGWGKFISLTGMLLSAIVHPFIYVFRNKMAYKEVSKLMCGFYRSATRKPFGGKESQPLRRYESGSSRSGGSGEYQPTHNDDHSDHYPVHQHPVYTPSTKSPKRSSLKSLTPQSSLNSTITNVNSLGPDSPIILNGTGDRVHFGPYRPETGKPPPFLRSLTLPEAPHRVKFPPNLIRQKSYYPRTNSVSAELTPALSRKSRFVRQDSICSITSSDSVLVICAEEAAAAAAEAKKQNEHQQYASITCNNKDQVHPTSCVRQDSNFSESSCKTTDSGVVLDMRPSNTMISSSQITSAPITTPSNARLAKNGIVVSSRPSSTAISNHVQCLQTII